MRTILINWLSDMHKNMKLRQETHYIAVNLLDRFLERMPVKKMYFHLVGIASLWIAIKFEEINIPQIKEFIYITNSNYRRSEIFAMELKILITLNFQVSVPSSNTFLAYLCHRYKTSEQVNKLAQCLTEIALLEGCMVTKYLPSKLALSALKLAIKIMGEPHEKQLTGAIVSCLGYKQTDIL